LRSSWRFSPLRAALAKLRAAWVMADRPRPPAAPTMSCASRAASSHFSSPQACDSALVNCSAVTM
jgi:hypothetical protein